MSLRIKQPEVMHVGANNRQTPLTIGNIRYDDTIDTIKQKIIIAEGQGYDPQTEINTHISIDSIYLFTKLSKKISDEKLFKELTKSRGKFNTLDTKDINVLKQNCGGDRILKEKKFKYEHFKQEFGDKNKKCDHPLGHSIFYKNDYAFVTNPFKLIIDGTNRDENDKELWDTFLFDQENNKNLIKYSGKKLLFEYLNPDDDNVIYYCKAKDIGKFIFEGDVDRIHRPIDFYKYILQIYFPKLFYIKKFYMYEHDDTNINILKNGDDWAKNHKKIEHFYEFYNEKNKEEGQITSINLTIHMVENVKIPINLIFKILNSEEGMPMLKLNPGKGREDIFRLYTKNYLSKDSLKLPYLYVNDDNRHYKIKNIHKRLALNKCVGIYIIVDKIEMYCELYPDGSINIKIENINKTKEDLEKFIENQINEYILGPINKFVKKSGFEYPLFEKLTDDKIEIKNMKYRFEFTGFLKRENFKMSDFNGAINQIYQTYKTKFKTKGEVDFYYKKVSSYKSADAKEAYIINYMREYGQGVEVDKDLIELLVDNKLVKNKQEAEEEIRKSKENLALNLTVYSSKKIEIRDSPGFKVTLSKDLKNTILEYENINHYNYLTPIDVYTTYLYHNFLNSKKKEVRKLLSDKFGGPKTIKINQDPVNKDIQKEAVKAGDSSKTSIGGIYADADDTSSDEDDSDEEQGGGASDSESDEEEEDKGSGSDSDSDEEEEIYGNLENIRVKGANNYFIKKIKKAEPYLYAKRNKKGKMFSFATSCPSNYSRTPVLLTSKEKEKIDEMDRNSKSRSYDEHITTENDNHYICPRFWCLSDKKAPNGRSLSFQQVNQGECGGWDAIIGKTEKPSNEKRIYEFTDEKYHQQYPGNNLMYRPHYPGWSRKKVPKEGGEGEENICIPCCYNMPRAEYKPKEWEEDYKRNGEEEEFKYWETAPKSFQRQNDPNQSKKTTKEVMGEDGKVSKSTTINSALPPDPGASTKIPYEKIFMENMKKNGHRRGRKTPRKNNMREKEFTYCDGKKKGVENNEVPQKTIEFMSIPIIQTFPLKFPGQLGYLPSNVQKLFSYDIVERIFKKKEIINGKETGKMVKNSKLPPKKWVLIRLGMESNDILSNIGNVMKYYKKNNNTEPFAEVKITDSLVAGDSEIAIRQILINWLEFYREDLAANIKFSQDNEAKCKSLFDLDKPQDIDEYKNKIKNNNDLKRKFISMNKGNLYQMFKKSNNKIEDVIVNFIRFVSHGGASDTKAHEIFWDIITTPISEGGAFFEKGINLIILKRPKEDLVDKIDIVCPNNNFFNTAYNKDRPTVILYTENNLYEPIYMIKKPKARAHDGWPIVKMFSEKHKHFDKINKSRFKDVITTIIKEVDVKCKKAKGIKTKSGYYFEENKTLNEWLDGDGKNTINGLEVEYQLRNNDYQVIAVVMKGGFILPCAPSSLLKYIKAQKYDKYVTKNNGENLLDKKTTEFEIGRRGLSLDNDKIERNVIREGKIIGIRTKTNQIIPVIPISSDDPEKNIIDELKEHEVDKKILLNYPHQDKDREEIMKKIKLESNFYSMYRNLFKILINKEDQKRNKERIINILNDVTKSYWEKIRVIQEEIKIMNDYIKWTNIDMGVFPDDLINCLGLNKDDCDGPTCFKNGDTCQFIIPEYNLLYEEDDKKKKNKELYKVKLTDEIVRYEKIREYILKNDAFLNFDKVEYKINDNEIIILENMFFQLYINNIDEAYRSKYITNYNIYDNSQSIEKYGKRRLTLAFEDVETGDETDYDSEDDSDSVVEEKEKAKKPKAKKTKAKKTKAKKDENKWSENEIKFVAFYLFYNFLMSRKINDLTIEKFIQEYKIIDLLVKKREEYAKKPSLGVIIGSLINEWSNSEFKEIRLDKKKQETDWEKNYKKKYRDDFKWPLVQFKYAIDRFMQVIWVKKPKTVGEALDVFYKEVIMQNNKPEEKRKGPQAIAKLATYEKKD